MLAGRFEIHHTCDGRCQGIPEVTSKQTKQLTYSKQLAPVPCDQPTTQIQFPVGFIARWLFLAIRRSWHVLAKIRRQKLFQVHVNERMLNPILFVRLQLCCKFPHCCRWRPGFNGEQFLHKEKPNTRNQARGMLHIPKALDPPTPWPCPQQQILSDVSPRAP